jgi:hypothetical protein
VLGAPADLHSDGQVVAAAILDGIEADDEDIFPDPDAKQAGKTWLGSPKELERAFGAM